MTTFQGEMYDLELVLAEQRVFSNGAMVIESVIEEESSETYFPQSPQELVFPDAP